MKKDELDIVIKDDPYLIPRINPSELETRDFLREVDFRCPLCGKLLSSNKLRNTNKQVFEIAHIYPNKPTIDQYINLKDLERLGENCESFENKIALCVSCHRTQDFRTDKERYIRLLNIKKQKLNIIRVTDIIDSLSLEKDIIQIIEKLQNINDYEPVNLNKNPTSVANKFDLSEGLLKQKVWNNVSNYYCFIDEQLKNLDGKNDFQMEVLCNEIRNCFLKISCKMSNKEEIFNSMVDWIKNKTMSQNIIACECIVSYFVQKCEVYDEIAK